ncbi:Transcriptional activator protein DAL81 [Candida viswanathii]|uniref:Transcriptional activator protein DAL81 n=2 Tax=Candida viswanathii TaxID=5486 RepID=A0A367Y9F8_9ASCO|nr:Transcriptional activator protein DAL81 [Candida viswanathii]
MNGNPDQTPGQQDLRYGNSLNNNNNNNNNDNDHTIPVLNHSSKSPAALSNNNGSDSNDKNGNTDFAALAHASNQFSHDIGGHQSPSYLDHQWAPQLLDAHTADYLFNLDLPNIPNNQMNSTTSHNSPSIIQSIQYQQNVHQGTPNLTHSVNQPMAQQQQQQQQQQQDPAATTSSTSSLPLPTPQGSKAVKHRRPCDQCRKRKTKCVIVPNTDNCVQCEAKQLTCTYTSQAPKRKPTDQGNDQIAKRERMDTNLLPNGSIQAPDVPIRDVPPVQEYSTMNNSLLKKTLSLQFPRSSFYVGPTSYLFDRNLLNSIIDSHNASGNSSSKVEQVSLSNSISLRKVSDDVQFVLKDDQSPQSYQTMSNDVDTIEKFISPHGQILVDLYFRIIHPSYPIIHKKVFIEKYSRTHREFTAPLLSAVYVLAIQWWDYDPQLNKYPKPNVEMILKIGMNNFLLEILKRPKLSAVQAGLLLLQCKHILNAKQSTNQSPHIPSEADYSEWVLCSQVVALAEELGLGLDCSSWKLPKWERGLRRRLAWAVYLEDKWLSLKLGRPTHISENNWVVLPLHEEDFPEKHGDGDLKEGSSDIDSGKKIFFNLIDLSKILSDILNEFYSVRAMNTITEISEVLRLAKPLQLRLRDWFRGLPVELQMSSVKPRKLCSNGYLQLAYFATELTLHRKITTIIYQQTRAGNPPPAELVSVCRSAAKTRLMASIEFVRDLKPEHIHSFWHCSASSNFTLIGTFAAILFISAPTKEEADFYREQIFTYRWTLKVSSKGFEQAAEALTQLDIVLANIPGILQDNVDTPIVLPNVQDMPLVSPHQPQGPSSFSKSTPPLTAAQQRIRAPIRESPLSSPQNMYTPPVHPTVATSAKNSPVSQTQGLSPRSNKKTSISANTPNSPMRSPEVTK